MAMVRRFTVKTPLGEDVLLLKSMTGHETLGRLFRYEVELLCEAGQIDANKLIGEPLTVTVQLPDGSKRYFSGVVTSIAEAGGLGGYARFLAVVEPWLALLDLTNDCRIFQAKAVPEIMKQVFRDLGFSDFEERIYETYPEWEYMAQYRESAFAFVSRLMEQEGIYYYFKHSDGRHELVLADSPSSHEPAPGFEEIPFYPPSEHSDRREEEHFTAFAMVKQIQSGAYATTDFDFKRPKVSLMSKASDPAGHTHADLEVYDYPGEFLQASEGAAIAKRKLEELQLGHERYDGAGNVSGVGVGHTFKLTNHTTDAHNKEYLVTSCRYNLVVAGYESGASTLKERFEVAFSAVPSKTQFRTPAKTPKPHIRGPQTAVVVGPGGEEIWVDEFGRIKVQFHWDRLGKNNENSSCWVRVSQAWAGPGFGAIQLPRIGQEVVVEFLEGDPDRPIVTGRVYNADNMPPYKLPDNKTQSGIKSRSSKGGAADNANELRFEDKKGSELLFMQAEKDFETVIKNDERRTVKNDRKKDVTNNEDSTIGKNRTESVGENESISIGKNRALTIGGNHDVSVDKAQTTSVTKDNTTSIGGSNSLSVDKDDSTAVTGAQSISIGKDRSLTVSGGHTIAVTKDENHTIDGAHNVKVKKDGAIDIGKKMSITVADQLTIKVGKASITMKKDGTITIDGKDIKLNGSGKIDIKASSDVKIKGSKVGQN
ncbi:MAG: type VI secretion system tip protein TssI/VgrG [Deltaproteobacteria bacterium]|nr:type VI secretion system tip protein TssI/VgrG [Deltaproteobacteria bacterium]